MGVNDHAVGDLDVLREPVHGAHLHLERRNVVGHLGQQRGERHPPAPGHQPSQRPGLARQQRPRPAAAAGSCGGRAGDEASALERPAPAGEDGAAPARPAPRGHGERAVGRVAHLATAAACAA
uniref:Uncharacterized protein n=1 Tax=Setaria italica TaxID=4555 RepID=K3ZY44_SETIT